MRNPWLLSAVSLAALVACGKDDESGVDLRNPPPIPESAVREAGGLTPANGGRTAPAPLPKPEAKPEPKPEPKPEAKPEAKPEPKPGPASPDGANAKPPALEVKAAKPLKKTVAITVDYTGQTLGSETVEIRARVEGFLQSIHFTEGTFVKQGDLLYEIDREKMQQIVEQAEGILNVAKANEEKAEQDVNRNRPLVEKNAIPREDYDTSLSALKAAHAQVEAAQAAVERAKINMGYATVKAPVDGLIGKTEVDVGNLVGKAEATLLTTISKIDPIYAEVRISETDMLEYRRTRPEGGRKDGELDLTLFFSDGSEHDGGKGKIAVIDRNIDQKTGTILVQVSFPNPKNSVRPGQFARVRAIKQKITDALLVPQGCVDELQGTYRLYVLTPQDTVTIKTVKTGARLGPLWVISEGITADDRVVVEGRQKAREGMAVRVAPVEITDEGVSAGAPGSGGN